MSTEWPNKNGQVKDNMVDGPVGDDKPERVDTLHHILAGEYRRAVLQYLVSTEDGVASIESLIDHIVEEENLADSREDVALRFHHVTLPKLAHAGLIEYDQRSATVRYRDDPLFEDKLETPAQLQER